MLRAQVLLAGRRQSPCCRTRSPGHSMLRV